MSPPKLSQNPRKFSGYPYVDRSNVNWKSASSSKCTKCNKFHEEDNQSAGEESQAVEAKTSEETLSGGNSEANTEEGYSPEAENQPAEYPYDYKLRSGMNKQAEVVLNKLQELQWRRDALERHYTNGIRKIIDDYFFGESKYAGGHAIAANEERMRAGGIKKSQAYGVRLDCGCLHNCDRTRQKHISSALQNPSTSVNYPSDCKARCASRSEAVRST